MLLSRIEIKTSFARGPKIISDKPKTVIYNPFDGFLMKHELKLKDQSRAASSEKENVI